MRPPVAEGGRSNAFQTVSQADLRQRHVHDRGIRLLGTGGAYAANTVRSTDIVDGQVNSADVKDQSLTTFDVSTFLGADIVDGSLTGHDVGAYSGAVFVSNINSVPAFTCAYGTFTLPITPHDTDHVTLTPQFFTSSSVMSYTPEISDSSFFVKACNPTASAHDGNAVFNVLVIPQ
jgi:hypothetical protein